MDNKRKSNVIQDITLDDLADCFKWGVDYGLLLAEQERECILCQKNEYAVLFCAT